MNDQDLADALRGELLRQYPDNEWRVNVPHPAMQGDMRFAQDQFVVQRDRTKTMAIPGSTMRDVPVFNLAQIVGETLGGMAV